MKWDALKCNDDEDILEYATHFKKIYKRMNPQKRTPIRTIVWKFINFLPPKYVELLTIIGLNNLNKTIEAVLDMEASQKIKVRKRDQAYMIDTIEEFRQEVHNLQVS